MPLASQGLARQGRLTPGHQGPSENRRPGRSKAAKNTGRKGPGVRPEAGQAWRCPWRQGPGPARPHSGSVRGHGVAAKAGAAGHVPAAGAQAPILPQPRPDLQADLGLGVSRGALGRFWRGREGERERVGKAQSPPTLTIHTPRPRRYSPISCLPSAPAWGPVLPAAFSLPPSPPPWPSAGTKCLPLG